MTQVINLYGGPGTGKSTTAARIFALLKDAGAHVELITEYVKQWAWENRTPVSFDQIYFLGKQARREYTLFGKVDHIITDSPLPMVGYYTQVFGTPEQASCFRHIVHVYLAMCREQGVKHRSIFLRRVKPYNPRGRFQNEEEARRIDGHLRAYLDSMGIACEEFDGSPEGADALAQSILCPTYSPVWSRVGPHGKCCRCPA